MMHVLARESCFTCHFPHLLCQRWSILIMKHTHCQCRWEPAGQRSVNKASSHRLGNRNHVVNLFWNFFLGNKCSSKYWSCLSQIGKLKWYSCPRLVLLMARSTCHPECYHLLFQFGQWMSVIVLRLALPSPIRFPMACKTAIPRGNPCALGVSFLVSYILCFLNQKTGKGATWPLQLVKLGHINGDSDGTSLHRRSKVIPGSYRINHMGYMEDTLSVWKSLPCFDRLKTVDSYAARTLWDILNILRNLWVYLAKNIARVVSKKKRNTVPSWNVENHTCTLALNFIHHWSWTEGTGYFTSFLNP